MARPPIPLEDRFWGKVDRRRPDECWPWMASTVNGKGYGQIGAGGPERRMLLAHRVSYVLAFGSIPEVDDEGNKILVRHKCDNRSCVNPAHLELGTTLDNARDMVERGRATQGAHYRDRAECSNGHPFTPANTRMHKASPNKLGHRTLKRRCRECDRVRDRKRRSQNG